MDNIKLLHTWEVTVKKTVDETTTEQIDGQPAKVTRPVTKEVATKMGLKQPTRRELKQAELFYGKKYNWYVNEGFLPSSILINKHLNLTGGVLSDKEKDRMGVLTRKQVELENDLVRSINEPLDVKDKIQKELAQIRTELVNLYSVNQTVFAQSADKRAERDLNDWFAYYLIMIEKNGKWEPYFEGDTFEKKEEHLWKLEEANDEFYNNAVSKISTYIQFFNMGLDTPEKFKAAEEELKKQLEAKKEDTPEPAPESAPASA